MKANKTLVTWFTALGFVVGSTLAHAEREGLSVPQNPKWKEECGSCHIAYPPQLLTADSWEQVMGNLGKHFGANASMDAKDASDILDYLKRHAGSGDRHSAASLRISDTQWFKREHREVPRNYWADKRIKSASNCTACHVNAARGDWSEHGIRMPSGMRMEDD
ncbi:MAG: diheme cytochrome c [Nitrosomonadales bacterium]|nr:diheme cytochrome c [Nitrosomonadales bacterium]